MPNINRVIVTGNLTRDPELRQTGSGTSVCSLRIAVNDRRKVGDEWKDVAGYYDVTVWGRQGENAAQYLERGRPVAIDGRLEYREWQTEEGAKRSAVQIVADSVQFLSAGQGERRDDAPASDEQPAADLF